MICSLFLLKDLYSLPALPFSSIGFLFPVFDDFSCCPYSLLIMIRIFLLILQSRFDFHFWSRSQVLDAIWAKSSYFSWKIKFHSQTNPWFPLPWFVRLHPIFFSPVRKNFFLHILIVYYFFLDPLLSFAWFCSSPSFRILHSSIEGMVSSLPSSGLCLDELDARLLLPYSSPKLGLSWRCLIECFFLTPRC